MSGIEPWVAWIGESAARVVARSSLEGRPAAQLAESELEGCRALVLTAAEVALLRDWRARGITIPAIVLSMAADAIEQRAALEPLTWVSPDAELEPALERLGGGAAQAVLTLGAATVDLERRTVSGLREARLTSMESRVLGYLAARRGRAISREELLREVWGYSAGNTNTVPVMIGRIRKKIEENSSKPRWLLTCRGDGYRLVHGGGTERLPQLTGRDVEVREAERLLSTHGRVGIHGWPGIGKTRLARTLLANHTHVHVDVAGVSDITHALRRIGAATRSRVPTPDELGTALEGLARWGLDGVDDLDDSTLTALLEASPVPLIVVSDDARTPLAASSLGLGPLGIEDGASLLQAIAARHGTAVSSDDARRVVSAVDALPLAIELAGALLPVLSVEAVLASLTGSARDDGPLAGMVTAILERRSTAERTTLGLLSIFQGAFDPEVAATALGPGALHLRTLVDTGLVHRHDDGWLEVPGLLRNAARDGVDPGPIDAVLHDCWDALLQATRTAEGHAAVATLARWEPDMRAVVARGAAVGSTVWRARLVVLHAHGTWVERRDWAQRWVDSTEGAERGVALISLGRIQWSRDRDVATRHYDAAAAVLTGADRDEALYEAAQAVSVHHDWDGVATRLSAIEPSAPDGIALRARALDTWRRYVLKEVSESTLESVKLEVARQLFALGWPVEAMLEVIQATGTLRLSDAPRALREIRAAQSALEGVFVPERRLEMDIAEAELIHEVEADHDAALAVLDRATERARRTQPARVGVIDGCRGTLLWDAGQLDAARACLERNLDRERLAGGPVARLSVLLDLIGLEIEAERWDAARAFVAESRQIGLDRYVEYVDFEDGTLHALTGQLDEGLALLDQAARGEINVACGLSAVLRGIAVCRHLGRDDTEWRTRFEALAGRGDGRVVADARALLEGFDRHDLPPRSRRSGLNRVDRLVLRAALESSA